MKMIFLAVALMLLWGSGIVRADFNTGQSAYERSDYTTAFRELQPMAERGHPEAQLLLGKMYFYGWGVKKDRQEAIRWYSEAASRGLSRARDLLIRLCEHDSDPQKIAASLEKSKPLKPIEIVREGRSVCFKSARLLEARLEKDPDEAVPRYRLLGYYYFNGLSEIGAPNTIEARRRHILWLIEHQPDGEAAGLIEAGMTPAGSPLADPQGYAEGSRIWMQQLDRPTAKTAVFIHAADYHQVDDKPKAEQILLTGKAKFPEAASVFDAKLGYLYAMAVLGVTRLNHTGIPVAASREEASAPFATKARRTLEQSNNSTMVGIAGKILSQYGTMMLAFGTSQTGEMKLAEKLLTRAAQLDPDNPFWSEILGQHLYTLAKLGPAAGATPDTLKRALGFMEDSLQRTTDPAWRVERLREVAKLAFTVADYAKAEQYARELLALAELHPKDENYGPAWHDGHLVMGRLALKRKSPADARNHLLEAGKTAGGGTLSSFGPNMSLANDLLDHGDKQVVIDYLRRCKNFWTVPQTPIDRWIQEIERGQKPDFAANLNY